MENKEKRRLPVIFLMGPTATGKTGYAAELVQKLPLEIVSVDSAMVYRGMNIGTAKPEEAVLKKAPHRLIDVCDPVESYSAGNFVEDANREIQEIHALGKIPLLVGGTGLYFRSLEQGFSLLPPANPEVRTRLEAQLHEHGLGSLFARLQEVDPASAQRINENDHQRIQRALEIYEITGKPSSQWYAKGRQNQIIYPVIKIVIAPQDRATLHEKIEQRFMKMLGLGLVDELKILKSRYNLHPGLPSMRLVGYRQVWDYLAGKYSYKNMINKGIIATRQLAKRQFTWLRKEQNAHWVDNDLLQLSQYLPNYIESRALNNCS
jgi:tRNA dimethylallyltransferase